MTPQRLRHLLAGIPRLRVAVLGDLFLDRYLDIWQSLEERSLETGLPAHQVAAVRDYPGAAGNVAANLAALGCRRVELIGLLGRDGDGQELHRQLQRAGVGRSRLIIRDDFRTQVYLKPMLHAPGKRGREMSRLDIRRREPLPKEVERLVLAQLDRAILSADALLVADQAPEAKFGIVSAAVRERLARLARRYPNKIIAADSRSRIALFRNVILKPNRSEATTAMGLRSASVSRLVAWAAETSRRNRAPVFVTLGASGCLCAGPAVPAMRLPAFKPSGPFDVVGAGDAFFAASIAALAAGGSIEEAGTLGNLAAAVCLDQLGVTGHPSPAALRQRLAAARK